MSYIGHFSDINDNKYTVEISTGGQQKEVILGGNPFTTTMDKSKNNMYVPIKYQGATISILTPLTSDKTTDYMFDVYRGSYDAQVTLKNGANNIVWVGYVTPNMYDLDFTHLQEMIDIECCDGLTLLLNYQYEAIGGTGTRSNVTFETIIRRALKKCGCYRNFYVSDNYTVNLFDNTPAISIMTISEAAIFDDKKNDAPDIDKGMKWSDVLSEVCKYAGLTCVAYGTDVFFLDYDAIRNGNNSYYKFGVYDDTNTKVTLYNSKTIEKTDYSNSNNTLSLDDVYNKVKVKAELKEIDEIMPDIFEGTTNNNANDDEGIHKEQWLGVGVNRYPHSIYNNFDGVAGSTHIYILPEMVRAGEINDSIIGWDLVGYRFLQNSSFSEFNSAVDCYRSYEMGYNKGGFLAQFAVQNISRGIETDENKSIDLLLRPYKDKTTSSLMSNFDFENITSLSEKINKEKISKLKFDNHILLINKFATNYPMTNEEELNDTDDPGDSWQTWGDLIHKTDRIHLRTPYIKIHNKMNTAFGGKNNYIILSGKINQHIFELTKFPLSGTLSDKLEIKYCYEDSSYIYSLFSKLPCMLKWGNKYWNGSNWSDTECGFDIEFFDGQDFSKDLRSYLCSDIEIKNNVSWASNIEGTGYIIPVNEVMTGEIELTIFKPYPLVIGSQEDRVAAAINFNYINPVVTSIKDLKIETAISQNGIVNTDTIYTMLIDENYINEMKELSFKFNTYNGIKPSHSYVTFKTGNTYNYILSNVKHSNLNCGGVEGNKNGMTCPEWWYCYKIYKQYKDPAKVLTLNLRNDIMPYSLIEFNKYFDGSKFIVDSISADYRFNRSKIKIIEKK